MLFKTLNNNTLSNVFLNSKILKCFNSVHDVSQILVLLGAEFNEDAYFDISFAAITQKYTAKLLM